MPKPDAVLRSTIFNDWYKEFRNGNASPGMLANELNEAWEKAWPAEEAERESVWHSFHRAWTACVGTPRYDKAPWRECAKQVGDVVGRLGHTAPEAVAALETATAIVDEVEQFNREQRIRRLAYEDALKDEGRGAYVTPQSRAVVAAARYPLRKRVPKVIPDSHGQGEWSTDDSGSELAWRDGHGRWGGPTPLSTAARVRALVALLDEPWTVEEDTSVEDGDAPRMQHAQPTVLDALADAETEAEMQAAEVERLRTALQLIAGADLKRTSAGWLVDVAKEALR